MSKADSDPKKGSLRLQDMRKQRQISTPCPKHPGQTRKNPEGNPHTHPRAPLVLPSSWAVVKADGSPSSSITEQLLLGSHIVPTSAMPSVSQVVAPHRSCRDGGRNKSQPEISDRYRRDLMEDKASRGMFQLIPTLSPTTPSSFLARSFLPRGCRAIHRINPG